MERIGWVVAVAVSLGAASSVRAERYSLTDLGTLGGAHSEAYGINDLGQVVGVASTAKDGQRAFLWSGGAMQDLGMLPHHDRCYGTALNIKAQVVGWCTREGHATGGYAFVYRAGRMHDLNKMLDPVSGAGWLLKDAHGINDFGQIVGMGRRDGGPKRAYLLTPIKPE